MVEESPLYSISMGTMNKTSIREEIERLQDDLKPLCSAGKVSPETRVVMNCLLVVVELILAVFLEKKTRENSTTQLFLFRKRLQITPLLLLQMAREENVLRGKIMLTEHCFLIIYSRYGVGVWGWLRRHSCFMSPSEVTAVG